MGSNSTKPPGGKGQPMSRETWDLCAARGPWDMGTYEEYLERFFPNQKKRENKVSKEICICGHSMARHSTHMRRGEEVVTCAPRRVLECGCEKPLAVIEVPDKRLFMFQSQGQGKEHALIRGLEREFEALGEVMEKNAGLPVDKQVKRDEVKWLPAGLTCQKCGEEKPVSPVSFDKHGRLTESTPEAFISVMMCGDCYRIARTGGETE